MAVGELSFGFGGDTGAKTPEELAKRRAIAEALAGRIFGQAPKNVGEGLSAIGQALALRSMNAKNAKAEAAGRESASGAFGPIIAALGGGQFPAAPAAPGGGSVASGPASGASASAPNPNVGSTIDFARAGPESYRNAIASIESAGSGDYAAVGPTHPKMGRALGRYQIMEANIGPWSKEVLGQEVTPEQFMADPKIQDAIFDGKFGGYVQQFGPEGAAQAWFAGPGGVGKTDRRDVLGTDVGSYGQKFLSALNGTPQQPAVSANEAMATGTQVASLDPSIGLPPDLAAAGAEQGLPPDHPGLAAIAALQEPMQTSPTMVPGEPAATSPQGNRLLDAMTNPQSMTGGAPMPMQGVPQAPQPVQTAQAQPMPEMAGNTAPVNGSAGPSLPQLLQAVQNPWLSEGQRSIVNALIGQQMERNDPLRQMEMERAQIELEQLRNPQLTPSDQLAREKFEFEKQNAKPDAPNVQTFYDEQGREYKAQWTGSGWEPIGGAKAPSGFSIRSTPDGGFEMVQGNGKLTENQSKLTLFQSLQTETQPVLLDLEKQFDPANIPDAAARSAPVGGNFFQSEQGQIYSAAATAWAEGALRIATGAAATPEEMERTKKAYFAQPGDTPNTIAFKAQMREMYNRSINRALGKDAPGTLPNPSEFAKKFDDEQVPDGDGWTDRGNGVRIRRKN